MPILFKCELCRARLSISRKKAGKMGTCPKCGEPIHIPPISEAKPIENFKPKKKAEQSLAGVASDSSFEHAVKPDPATVLSPAKENSSQLADSAVADSGVAESAISDSDERIFDITEQYVDNPAEPLLTLNPEPATGLPADDPASADNDSTGAVLQSILIPRWIVYFQAGLIGVVAATFFVFGMMVGNMTSGNRVVQTEIESFKISGRVELSSGIPDSGAVVIALPALAKPEPRPEPGPLHPDQFEPVDNPSLDQIRDLGGDVVRVNRSGEFELEVDGPAEFYLLVISKAQSRGRGSSTLDKEISAKLGRYFLPYDPLIEGKEINWSKIRMTSDKNVGMISF